jgi:uncharacterized membrane protein
MAVLFALCSALAYGLSDFIGGLVSRRTSPWAVAVVAQISSTTCTAAAATFVLGSPTPTDFAWATLAGLGSGAGGGFLYRGFARGRMGVVAPVSAVGAAVIPVAAGVIGGERPSLLVWCGVVAALPGIWFVSSPPPPAGAEASPAGRLPPGLTDALLAGAGFGLLFTALAQVPSRAGLWPLAATQAVSLPSVVLLAIALGGQWVPRGRPVRWALLAGPLGALAAAGFLAATHAGYLTVAAVLSSLYPASTVLLAAVALREAIHRRQALGLGLCALAVVLVAAG